MAELEESKFGHSFEAPPVINNIHVKSTDGLGLWISDSVIENLFSNIVLSDNCGNMEYPAMLIEPKLIDAYGL